MRLKFAVVLGLIVLSLIGIVSAADINWAASANNGSAWWTWATPNTHNYYGSGDAGNIIDGNDGTYVEVYAQNGHPATRLMWANVTLQQPTQINYIKRLLQRGDEAVKIKVKQNGIWSSPVSTDNTDGWVTINGPWNNVEEISFYLHSVDDGWSYLYEIEAWGPVCGDGACDPGEDSSNCPQDCGKFCSSPNDTIMKLFPPTNSHGALWDYSENVGGEIFGNTNVGSSSTLFRDKIVGGVYTAPFSGMINNISMYISALAQWTAGEKIKCAIYDENRNFIASTEERDDGGSNWQIFDFASPVPVIEGQNYSLVCWGDNIVYVGAESIGQAINYQQNQIYGSWPASLSPAESTYEKSIYTSYGEYYNYEICYSETGLPAYTGTDYHPDTCSAPVLWLNGSNSLASTTSDSYYDTPVCYGNLTCHAINESAGENCDVDEEIVVSLQNYSNSLIANASEINYPIKICCKPEAVVVPPEDVYWADMDGVPLTEPNNYAQIGDTVLMIYKGMAGQSYAFEVWESDFTDEFITTASSFDYGIDLAAKFTITQEFWQQAKDWKEIGDPEFIFKVNGIISDDLIVPEGSDDNSPPTTQIINPAPETNYTIKQGTGLTGEISFEQISSDEDDDLKVFWDFGDGSDSGWLMDCLTTGNCNTTYIYSEPGTKNIILTAKEMTRTQKAKDYSRIYIYREGIIVFVIMDKEISGRVITIDATKTHVSDCYYEQLACDAARNAPDSGAITDCYNITDELEPADKVFCYDIGIVLGENFFLDWTFDGIPDPDGPTQIDNEMRFIKVFGEPGEHIINLNAKFKLPE